MLYEYDTVWRSVSSNIDGPIFYDAVNFLVLEQRIERNRHRAEKNRLGGFYWQEYHETCER
jgi:hypothetical protein